MKKTFLVGLITSALLVGCGSDSPTIYPTVTIKVENGTLVDNEVANVTYVCADGKVSTTEANGSFSCSKLPVTFKVGGVTLGSIDKIPADKYVFPQDLVGVSRNDINDSNVTSIARFLQSCDEDGNLSNGIRIKESVKTQLQDYNETLRSDTLYSVSNQAQVTLVNKIDAQNHLKETTNRVNRLYDCTLDYLEEINATNATVDVNETNFVDYVSNNTNISNDLLERVREYCSE